MWGIMPFNYGCHHRYNYHQHHCHGGGWGGGNMFGGFGGVLAGIGLFGMGLSAAYNTFRQPQQTYYPSYAPNYDPNFNNVILGPGPQWPYQQQPQQPQQQPLNICDRISSLEKEVAAIKQQNSDCNLKFDSQSFLALSDKNRELEAKVDTLTKDNEAWYERYKLLNNEHNALEFLDDINGGLNVGYDAESNEYWVRKYDKDGVELLYRYDKYSDFEKKTLELQALEDKSKPASKKKPKKQAAAK
jgi:uncharacterized FlaG/YvyC family protein